ncbi:MAG TPA: hypothetical protein VK842_02975 [bacterium]|jgi:hypothetical protein|nr:hypothetical protein [bacterium]
MRQILCIAAALAFGLAGGLRADASTGLGPGPDAVQHVNASDALKPDAPAISPEAPPQGPPKHVDAAAALAKAVPAQPVTKSMALYKAAVWPGILWHGAGYAYAGDEDTALGLSGMEGFSLFVTGFAGYEWAFVRGSAGENKDTATALTWAGGALFLTGWVWDMVGAPLEAGQKAGAPQVGLMPIPGGAAVSVKF